MPPDVFWWARSSCDTLSSTLPTCLQFTRSELLKRGTPGKKANEELTR